MIVLQIGIPKEHFKRLEDLAHQTGCDDVTDLIEKALVLMQEAVECVEDGGHIFFRYKDGAIVRLSNIVPDAEDPSRPIPPLDFRDADTGAATTLIDIIRKLGWEGPALRIIRDNNS